MTAVRRHLIAIALTTASMHIASLTVGAFRVCWGTEHRHAGTAAPECSMHHQPSAPAQDHGHHGHHAAAAPKDDAKVACNCANDPGSLFVSPSAVVLDRVSLTPPTETHVVSAASPNGVPETDLSPGSPPPRTSFS